jgi:2-succinyl-6-hydroxy-2,4-cyclohexadiene-1-carboxylate synthase
MIHMLHGAAGSTADWDEFGPLLQANGLRPVDLYSNKVSGFDSFAMSLNAAAAEGDVLIGYSMGGRLALHALLDEGSKWSKVVIISAHTGIIDPSEREDRLLSDGLWAQLVTDNWDKFVKKWSSQPVFGERKIPWCRSDRVAPGDKVQRCFTCWSLGRQRNLLPELASITIPVLWVSGEDDNKFSSIAKAATSMIPHAELAIISGSGHRCPWEQPELTAGVIRGFLSP